MATRNMIPEELSAYRVSDFLHLARSSAQRISIERTDC
jgi:hypothetical protein